MAERNVTGFFFAFLLLLVFLGSIFPVSDNDVWWHVRSGQCIVQTRGLQTADIFSFTIPGKHWTPHEWLSQVSFFLVCSISGLAGLTIFKALIVLLIFFLLLRSSKGADPLILWIVAAVAFLAMRDGLRERPQIFTYLFTAMYMVLLRSKDRQALLTIPFLQVLWANLHGAASVIGFGIVLLYALFTTGWSGKLRLWLPLGTAAAMFITPSGYGIFTYAYTVFTQGFSRLVLEYRPPQWSIWYLPYFLLLAAALFAAVRTRKERPADAAVILVASAASLMAIRNIPVFAIISVPIVSMALTELQKERREHPLLPHGTLAAGISGFLLLVLFWRAGEVMDRTGRYSFGWGDMHAARNAATFVDTAKIRGNLFNDYDFGGYLLGRLYPSRKVFIDSRLVEYGADLVEKSFYYWKPAVWDELENRYSLTAAIIPMEGFYNAVNFDRRQDWILVYWDDSALVYLKKTRENARLIRIFGYRILRPNDPSQEYLLHYPSDEVAAELDRSLYFAPHCEKAGRLRLQLLNPPVR